MNRTISYKGQIPIGEQERIRLRTIKGKVGYKITKFQLINKTALNANADLVSKIYTKSQSGSITGTVDFTEGDLIAVGIYKSTSALHYSNDTFIIFDNAIVNQDIFITMTDSDGGTDPGNYYLELEVMSLDDVEATMLTLQSIKTIIGQ